MTCLVSKGTISEEEINDGSIDWERGVTQLCFLLQSKARSERADQYLTGWLLEKKLLERITTPTVFRPLIGDGRLLEDYNQTKGEHTTRFAVRVDRKKTTRQEECQITHNRVGF